MATKSKNTNNFIKALCLILALALFTLSFVSLFKLGNTVEVLGVKKAFNEEEKKKEDFFYSNIFENKFLRDLDRIITLSGQNTSALKDEINSKKAYEIGLVAKEYTDAVIKTIKDELKYAISNYNGSYYEYEDTVNDVVVEPSTQHTDVTTVTVNSDFHYIYEVPADAPQNVKLACYALNNAKGKEFLDYLPLVRDEAFNNIKDKYYNDVYIKIKTANNEFLEFYLDIDDQRNKLYSEDEFKTLLTTAFDKESGNILTNKTVSYNEIEDLKSTGNLHFYVENFDGEIIKNTDKNTPKDLNSLEKEHYILSDGKKDAKVNGFGERIEGYMGYPYNSKYIFIYFDDFSKEDEYALLYNRYLEAINCDVNLWVTVFSASLAFAIALLVIFFALYGKYKQEDEINFRDKIPNDLHLTISSAIIFSIYMFFAFNCTYDYFKIGILKSHVLIPIAATIGCLFVLIFTEFITSLISQHKKGINILKNTVIYKIIKFFVDLIKKLWDVLFYKHLKIKKSAIILMIIFFVIETVLAVFTGLSIRFSSPISIVFFTFLLVVFNVFALFVVLRFSKYLDKIIEASSLHQNVNLYGEKVPEALSVLSNNINTTHEELEKAVNEAVKKEHMKTQLITNVSHDLKTPLTSLINYSDLLSKCDIEDEKAANYISVINQQSQKLKRLVEDLIEASKVSTGNVTLNKTKLNLSELSVQAVVEFTPELQKSGNEIKLNESEESIYIYADGNKTYRIISNLLSNTKKYSAPDTRVYVSVYKDSGFGIFEIKNTSKEELNISPEELKERFVRGDESRTNEGNGLGLSIANDLCSLQGGKLKITIDGDLFKASVMLPLVKESELSLDNSQDTKEEQNEQ